MYFEDVHEGMELPKYIYQPTPTHLFRWSAAIENWHGVLPVHAPITITGPETILPPVRRPFEWDSRNSARFLDAIKLTRVYVDLSFYPNGGRTPIWFFVAEQRGFDALVAGLVRRRGAADPSVGTSQISL